MEKDVWIVVVVLLLTTIGFILFVPHSSTPTSSISNLSSSTPTSTGGTVAQTPLPQTIITNSQDCQTAATEAATNDQASGGETISVVQSTFNQKLQQCYYELDIFTNTGNETDIRVAPNDQRIASCTTTSNNTLSCQKQNGTSITEPQFKALLAGYFTN